jgi:hypothetical protein
VTDSSAGVSESLAAPYLGVLYSSAAAGGLAGASHGGLFFIWEHAQAWLRGGRRAATLLSGTIPAHAVSHASLFGWVVCRAGGLK